MVRLVIAICQPATGWGRTVRSGVSSGIRTCTFVVAGFPASVGTPRVTTPNPPGPVPSSRASTWAAAAGLASTATAAPTASVAAARRKDVNMGTSVVVVVEQNRRDAGLRECPCHESALAIGVR